MRLPSTLPDTGDHLPEIYGARGRGSDGRAPYPDYVRSAMRDDKNAECRDHLLSLRIGQKSLDPSPT